MRLFLSFAILMLFVSCSDKTNDGVTTPMAVEFSDGVISRASGTQWSKGDCVGIYMLSAGTSTPYSYDGSTYSNIEYSNSAESGEGAIFSVVNEADKIYYPIDNSAMDFIAYYPYDATKMVGQRYAIDLSDQSAKESIDFMVATKLESVTPSTNPLAFNFKHKLSQMVVVVVSGEGNPSLEGLQITAKGLKNSASYDLLSGDIDFGEVVASDLTVIDQSAFVVPQSADVSFVIKTTDSPLGYETASSASIDFNSGETTTVTIILNRLEAEFTGVPTITNWVDSADMPSIDADQIPATFTLSRSAADTSTFESNIGIFMLDEDSVEAVNGVANIEHKYDSESGFVAVNDDETIYYPEGTVTVDFAAYIPYDATKVGLAADGMLDTTYEITASDAIDLMVAELLDNKLLSTENLAFEFNHVMSQIQITVSQGIGSPSLDGLKIKVSGLKGEGTCDIKSGEVTATDDTESDITIDDSGVITLVIPQTSSLTFTVTTASNPVGFSTNYQSFTFESGTVTVIPLIINLSDVDFNGASTINPWDTIGSTEDDIIQLF